MSSWPKTRSRDFAVRWVIALVVLVVTAAVGLVPQLPVTGARADEITASQNLLRDGWDNSEPGLSPSVVGGPSSTFGRLFSTPVDGQVYGQPLVVGTTLIVTTENDFVYGLDARTGAIEWQQSLGQPLPSTAQDNCTDLTPDIGVTSTPVYDPASGNLYVTAVVNDGPATGQPHVYMYALNPQTGDVQWKVPIQGAPVNDPTRPFNPLSERQRPGLLLMNGWVYVGFASYCDFQPYDGYVAGVNTSTRALTMWTDESGLTDSEAGIWQGGGGLMSDGPNRIFVATGNGVSPAPGPGTKPPAELGDAVVRLAVGKDGTLSAQDFFSPGNAPALDAGDLDFGSGGPVGLPFGATSYPGLLVQAGKDGRVFLLNRDNLGGREQGPKGSDDAVSEAGPYQGQWGHPAAFADTATVTAANTGQANDYAYYVGSNDYLRYLKFGLNGSGTPTLTDVADSSIKFAFTSGSPVVTSNGTDPASALVWEVNAAGGAGANTLDAFDAVPAADCTGAKPCSMSPVWSATIGTASKFSIPATNDGRVYVGTRDGHVLGFGSPDAAPVTGATPVNFGDVAVSTSSARHDVILKATAPVTINSTTLTSMDSTGPFTLGAPASGGKPVTLPVTLTAGQDLTVPVTFKPTAPGGVTGSLSFATDSANFPTISVSLTGVGTQAGFYATPRSLSFGQVPDGTSLPVNVTITNGGTGAETLQSVTPPTGPYTVTGLPAPGSSLAAGQSVVATVTYRPTAAGPDPGSFTLTAADHTSLQVPLSGTGLAAVSRLSPVPTSVSFGSVPLGRQVTQTIDITNSGNLPAIIKGARPPTVPFGAPDPVNAGLPVNPGYDLEVPITFAPASVGSVTGSYQLSWTDAAGSHQLTVPVTGTGTAPASGIAVPPPGGGWTLNGIARMTGSRLQLTQAGQVVQAGSAVYSVPVPTSGLRATFTAQLGGGNGGEGLAFSLLAAQSGPGALGRTGRQLGFGGLTGVAVILKTHRDPGDPAANFVGIATSDPVHLLRYAKTTTKVPTLNTGTHVIGVTAAGQQLTVTVDGKSVLAASLPSGVVPRTALLAFTGGNGIFTDNQEIGNASIVAGGNRVPPPGGGWSYNSSASMAGSDTVLTQAVTLQAGSVVYPAPVSTSGLQVTFDAQLSGGTGGAGLTFALLNPATSGPASIGGNGPEMGFGGLHGVAVTLGTYKAPGYPGNNFVATSIQAAGGQLRFQWPHAVEIGPLRTGTQTVRAEVTPSGGTYVLLVWLNGQQILQQPEPSLTPTSLLAFTGGTGPLTDIHTVRDVAISATK
jgi:hypothetical protein